MKKINAETKTGAIINVSGQSVPIIEFNTADDETVVKILADDDEIGIRAEYAWIKSKYPNYKAISQSLSQIELNGSVVMCDIINIAASSGSGGNKKIYFDISRFLKYP